MRILLLVPVHTAGHGPHAPVVVVRLHVDHVAVLLPRIVAVLGDNRRNIWKTLKNKKKLFSIFFLNPPPLSTHVNCEIIIEPSTTRRGDGGRGALAVQTRAGVALVQIALHLLPVRPRRQRGLEDVLAVHLLHLDVALPPPDRVDKCKLHETPEDESRAREEPNLTRLDVADLGQGLGLSRGQGDEGQHCARAQHDSRRSCVCLEPKGDLK